MIAVAIGIVLVRPINTIEKIVPARKYYRIYLRFRFDEPIDRPLLPRKVDRPLLLTSDPIDLPDESGTEFDYHLR